MYNSSSNGNIQSSVYWADLLVHSARKVFLGQFATGLVVGASVHLDTLQISRNDVFAFPWSVPNCD